MNDASAAAAAADPVADILRPMRACQVSKNRQDDTQIHSSLAEEEQEEKE
jgi:hypothetical protein